MLICLYLTLFVFYLIEMIEKSMSPNATPLKNSKKAISTEEKWTSSICLTNMKTLLLSAILFTWPRVLQPKIHDKAGKIITSSI